MKQIKCFCCFKNLEYEESFCDPMTQVGLYDGLWFNTSGNFGSTIFDPIQQEEYIRIAICDKCVKKNQEHAKHIYAVRRKTESSERPFKER